MKKNIHTSPDMFDPDKINVFDPDTSEFLGQIQTTDTGIKSSSFRDSSTTSINDVSEGFSYLRTAFRPKPQRLKITEWNVRQNLVKKNILKFR